MESTLVENSDIWRKKVKFFLFRALTYASFLLFPIWLPKSIQLPNSLHSIMIAFYVLFMVGQWFLLGKEIDHRLKIYFRVNSSIERVVYRVFLGMIFIIIYYNLLYILPPKWIYNTFWITWSLQGLYYSWPTRGKIIQESMSTNFSEYRYLDRFEKTLVGLIFIFFILSVPESPSLLSFSSLKLFFDPLENFHDTFWNFLLVGYFPFKKYPHLFKLAWSLHFYLIGLGFFFLTFYSLLRYFLSRRLSLLGVFALVSTWSFSKILAFNYGHAISTTYSIIFIWSFLWAAKSSTYRSGLFLGLIGFLGTLFDIKHFPVYLGFLLVYFLYSLREKGFWFRRQTAKYALFGTLLSLWACLSSDNTLSGQAPSLEVLWRELGRLFERKAFFVMAPFGVLILGTRLVKTLNKGFVKSFNINTEKIKELFLFYFIYTLSTFLIGSASFRDFSILWMLTLLSLIPLELLFQSISRLRSRRNMIYLVYILICLLDSHLEGRVKIFIGFLN